ncbi:hypothetical protein F5Y12DRAFT_650887 [Xylaria sp. FL1777]|nr:hypothetical protein F5Y12DRAFT_650887 [Xylaria sp. FL1777]
MVTSHSNSPKPEGSKHTAASSDTATFTPEMRDRQARGKNPYHSDSEDSDWAPGQGSRSGDGSGDGSGDSGGGGGTSGNASSQGNAGPPRVGAPKRDEAFAVYDRRRVASQILNSSELLMMAALRDDQSIPATRLKYTRVLCGVEEQSATSTRPGATRPSPSLAEKQNKRSNHGHGQGQRSA